jgi:nucleotide-binding universal stress UspA family protein
METQVSSAAGRTSPDAAAPIVVGVDGRGRSTSAVVWAADEAEHSGRGLRLVTVHEGDPGAEDPNAASGLAGLARRLTLADVQYVTAVGSASDVLLEEAADASLLVVGRRSRGPARRLLMGSTSTAVGGRSPVPVVVVPETWIQPSMSSAPVVVGVASPDPSTDADHDPDPDHDSDHDSDLDRGEGREGAVLAYAFDRAQRLRVPLIVVSAWQVPSLSWSPAEVARRQHHHEAALETRLAPWRHRHPRLEVVARSVLEEPEQALVHASQVSQLVVVGRHRGSRFGGSASGGPAGTTRGVLLRATRPVVVVPTGEPASARRAQRDVPAWAPMF